MRTRRRSRVRFRAASRRAASRRERRARARAHAATLARHGAARRARARRSSQPLRGTFPPISPPGLSAAKAYKEAAGCYQKAKSESEVAQCFIEASRCFIKAGDSKTATALLETEALPRMVDAGRLSQAAKLHQEVAEMFETEGSFAEAMDNFQKAADLFSAENAGSTASKCLARVAHLAAQLDPPDFEKASEVFAAVGAECMNSNLMKFSAKGYFLQAVLCTLARADIVAAEGQLERFREQDYTFESSREGKLLADVCAAVKDSNVEAFSDAIYNYDQISKLDPWKTSVLLKIKATITGGGGDGGDGGDGVM
jgi:alpha-soluble NSF attachment protein